MIHFQYYCCLLLFFCFSDILGKQKEYGHVQLSFNFISFDNSGGTLDNEDQCDSYGPFKTQGDYCDHFFEVCLEPKPLQQNLKCSIFYISTPKDAFYNQLNIHFGSKIGFLDNPILTSTNKFSNVSRLSVDVFDYNEADRNNKVETLVKEIHFNPSHWSASFDDIPPTEVSLTGRTILKVEIRVKCQKFYYGSSCTRKCIPQSDNYNGHFGCVKNTGEKICLPGWRGENCDVKDHCFPTNPCLGIGKCINTDTFFKCSCPPGVRGHLCQVPVLSCTEPSICLNNGICYRNHSTGAESCLCPWGLSGPHCLDDIDECSEMSPSICQNGGKCRNQFRSYSCDCSDNFFGTDCSIPLIDRAPEASGIAANGGQSANGNSLSHSTIVILAILCTLCFIFLIVGIILFFIVRRNKKLSRWNQTNIITKQVRYVRRNSSPRESIYEEVDDAPFPPEDYQAVNDGSLPQFTNLIYGGLDNNREAAAVSKSPDLSLESENLNHYELECDDQVKRFDSV